MKATAWVIIAAVSGFVVGTATQRLQNSAERPVDPAQPLLGELAVPGVNTPLRLALSPAEVARINRETKEVEAQADAFRERVRAMEEEFGQRIATLLTPAQKEKLDALRGVGIGSAPAKHVSVPTPGDVLTHVPFPARAPMVSAMPGLSPDTLYSVVDLTFVAWSLDNLRSALSLTKEQETAVRALLIERRARFLEWTDRFPPPTLRLLKTARELDARVIVE